MTPCAFKAHIDSLILKKENGDLKRENNCPKIEKLQTKGLYESFISQLKELNSKHEIKVKATIKQDKLNIYLLTSQPKPLREISSFLNQLSKNKNITIKDFSSQPCYFFSKTKSSDIRSSNTKITLPNSFSSYEILIETLRDTKAEITRELTVEKAVVDLSPKL